MALNLEVQILGQYKGLTKATKGATKQLQGLQSSVSRISRGINGVLATIGVGLSFGALKNGIQSVVAEASNLEQAYGATAAVFKTSSEQIIAASKSAATAFGLSANDYLQSANLIGAQLSNLGFSQDDYAAKTQGLVGLGADLAATFGGTTYEAVQALSAVFRGEYNQVEKYGVSIRKSDINARVAARGYKGATGELLKQQEALAALEILYGQTQAAQGQFSREANTLAGATQILRAGFANAKTEIGEGFYPVILAVAQFVNDNMFVWSDLADAIGNKVKSAFENTGDSAATFGGQIISTVTQLTEFLNGTATVGNVFFDLGEKMAPVLELIGAFGELGKGLIEVLNGLFDGLFGWLGLFTTGESTIGGFAGFVKFLGEVLQNVGYWIGIVISFFVPFTKGFEIAGTIISKFGGIVGKMLGGVGKVVSDALAGIVKFIDGVIGKIGALLGIKTQKAVIAAGDAAAGAKGGYDKLDKAAQSAIKNQNRFKDINAKLPKGLQKTDKALGGLRSTIGGLAGAYNEANKAAAGKGTKPGSTSIKPGATPPALKIPEIKTPKTSTTTSKVSEAAKAALEAYQKNVKKLIDTVTDALNDAKERVKSASENFRDSVQLSFGIITNGAFAVFDVNRVIRQMQKIKDAAKTFVDDIKALQAGGADQALIDQLLGMDPISGATAARGLLASGRLQEFLDLRKELAGIGGGAGEAANVGIYGTSTTNLETTLGKLNKLLEKGVSNVYNIDITNANNMTAQDIIAAIKKYEASTGKRVFSN